MIYSIGPQNVFWRRHFSRFYKAYLNNLLKSQWYSQEELKRLQNKKLHAVIKHAYETVPYYHRLFRSLNLKPDDIKKKTDLKKLPIIDKAEIRKNWPDFISKKIRWWQQVHSSTGGSTGSNLHIVWDKKAVTKELCYEERLRKWAGISPAGRIAHFGGSYFLIPENQRKPPFWRICIPRKQVYFSPFHLGEKYLPFYIEKLKKFSPQIIRGHPFNIYIIARYMTEEGVNGVNPDAIYTSSEMLLPFHRQTIEETFGCKVFDYYGNNERVAIVTQCERGKYHINSEYGIIEFIRNNEEIESGEIGEMICTGFINYAMPLIRYRIDDLAVPSDDRCGCKRGLPLVESIQGRRRDMIITKDGRYLPTMTIGAGIDEMKSIKEWQVIQKSREHYIINCVVDRNYDFETDLTRIRKMIRRRVGEGKIEINIMDSIKRVANKFRAVISEVSDDGWL